jgi:DNA-binding transcriptional LysR family regulator
MFICGTIMNMSASSTLDWDDVRVFLAMMRAASLRRAAQDLGISRPTAGRHLDALEERLGMKLFDRRPDGLHATAEAGELVAAAEEVERSMLALERTAQAVTPGLRGAVRVTLPAVAGELLMPDLVGFCRRWPEIELALLPGYDLSSLAEREADVAIRFMPHGQSPDAELAGRKAATAASAVYGEGDCWIGLHGGERDAAWVKASPFPDLPVRGAIYDGSLLRAACANGLGLALLPCFMADGVLPRVTEPQVSFDVWVLVHPDLRRNPRLRIFRDAMVEAIQRHRPALEGRVT